MAMRYAQIRDEFAQRIATGDLKPGDRVPPETEVSGHYSTSRATAARALRELDAKGLLKRRRGAGTFVSEAPKLEKPVTRLAMFTPWAVQGQGIGHFQTHVHTALSSLCAERGAELTLQGLPAGGSSYRNKLIQAADQLI